MTRGEVPRFLGGFGVLLAVLLVTSEFDGTGRWGPAILAAVLLAGVTVERVAHGTGPREAVRLLGLARPGGRSLAAAFAVGGLVLMAYPVFTAITGTAPSLRPDWPWLLIGVFAFNGVAEELVWRGYAYRRLRAGRSFGRAVLWTMPLVAVAHVPILVRSGPVVGAAALLVAAVTAIPLAYLFDTGRATIWAPAVVHTAIDSFKLVVVPEAALVTFSLVISAAGLVVPLLVLALPRTALQATGPIAPSALWRAVRWPVCALLVVGALLALASALDTGPPASRDAALLIGAPTLVILLPAATAWLLVTAVRLVRMRGSSGISR